jgi:hypothetical protein
LTIFPSLRTSATALAALRIFTTAALERAVSSNDRSRRLVISGTYQLPLGRGTALGKNWNRAVDALMGGWQVNGIWTYHTGFPISVTAQHLHELLD